MGLGVNRMKTRKQNDFPLHIMEDIVYEKNHDLLQENANIDGNSPMGQMAKIGSELSKFYAKYTMMSEDVRQAIDDNLIYPHDLDFMPIGTTTCCQIPLGQVLKDGFNTGHGHMREPSGIDCALALAAIIFQSNQNMQHGGQSFPMFDYDLAPYVEKTFQKKLEKLRNYATNYTEQQLVEQAWKETDRKYIRHVKHSFITAIPCTLGVVGKFRLYPSTMEQIHQKLVVYLLRICYWQRREDWVMVKRQFSLYKFLK